jgi:hypothetical protein
MKLMISFHLTTPENDMAPKGIKVKVRHYEIHGVLN